MYVVMNSERVRSLREEGTEQARPRRSGERAVGFI